MDRAFLVLVGISGAVCVALGASGAHTLQVLLSLEQLDTFETAVRYQFYHTLALLAVVVAIGRWPTSRLPVIAGWLFVAGILVFSGSLYLLVASGIPWLGAITPLGGVAFIAGWLALALAAWRA